MCIFGYKYDIEYAVVTPTKMDMLFITGFKVPKISKEAILFLNFSR